MPPSSPASVVLVVEDEDAVRRLVATMLTMSGFVVRQAGSAAEARRLIEADDAIDAALIDVSLPDGTGDDLARQLTTHRPGLRVLLTSGYPDAESAGLTPGTRFIQKPFTRSALVAALSSVIAP